MQANKRVRTFLAFAVLSGCVFSVSARENAPVVAVAPFKQFFDLEHGTDEQIRAIRDRVVIELLRNYDGVVLNRSYGYSVALEDAVKRLSAISEQKSGAEMPYGTEYAFAGMFQKGAEKGFECVLRVADIHGKDRESGRRLPSTHSVTIAIPAIDQSAPLIADAIAREAGLRRREKDERRATDAAVSSYTWAVLPFASTHAAKQRLKKPDGSSFDRTEVVLRTELALQKDTRAKLVDRSSFEQVLDEKTRLALDEAYAAEQGARLAGVDRLLLGRISAFKKDGVRIELLGVDTRTAEVLAGTVKECENTADLGSAVEEAVGELVASMRVPRHFAPALAATRAQEARFYLEMAQEDAQTHAFSGKRSAIELAEMAFLVARDDPRVVGEIVQTLARATIYEDIDTSVTMKKLMAETVDRIVKPYPELESSAPVLLARADMHTEGRDFEAAAKLIQELREKHPAQFTKEARRVAGLCLLENGQPREALDVLEKTDQHYKTLRIRLRAYRALEDEASEFKLMDTLTHFQLGGLEERYLELLAKHKGPQAVVDWLESSIDQDNRRSSRPDVRFNLAKHNLAAGNLRKAALQCQALLDEEKNGGWNGRFVHNPQAFKEQLLAMKEKAGTSEDMWLKACEVRPFPDKYAIYLQPLGESDPNLMEYVRNGVETFFGARTKLLPVLELTKEEPSYQQENNKYKAAQLLPDTVKRMHVPDDALAVVIMTREVIHAGGYGWIFHRRDGYGCICSYSMWQKRNQKTRELSLRNQVIAVMTLPLGLRGRFPCITGGGADTNASMQKKFAFSPEIQAKYKSLDLEDIHQRALEWFRKSGATIIPAAD